MLRRCEKKAAQIMDDTGPSERGRSRLVLLSRPSSNVLDELWCGTKGSGLQSRQRRIDVD